ncbi:MAG: hypothetical protein SNJ69_04595 [Chloroflexaceae bacterium]
MRHYGMLQLNLLLRPSRPYLDTATLLPTGQEGVWCNGRTWKARG